MAIEKHGCPVRLSLRPGDNGTKKLTQKYEDRLVCVRCRYDQSGGIRYKTVELVEEQSPWRGINGTRAGKPARRTPSARDRFGVRVEFHETQLRNIVKGAGGLWRPRQKLWELPFAQIEALGLTERIVEDDEDG